MSPTIATVVFIFGILGLFVLDRDRKARTSKALWIPVVWLLIVGSRPVSLWLQMAPPTDSPDQYLEGSPLDGAVFALLLTVGLIVLASRGRQVGALLRGNGPLLLFFLYCAASILWSDFPGVAFKRWIKFIGDFGMVLIVLTDPDPPAAIKRFFARTAFLLVPLSVLLIKYYPDLGRVYTPWTWTPLWIGVTGGKNSLGLICMIFGLPSLWRFLQEFRGVEGTRRLGPLIAHGTVLVMMLWIFAKVNSATSFSCFVLAGGLLAVVTSSTRLVRRPATVHLLVAAILSVSLSAIFLDAGALRAMGRDPTLTGRTDLWNQVLSMTTDPLLGTGFESFWLGERVEKMWSMYWWRPNQAHNGYLEVFLNLGWVGVALLAVVLVTGYRNAVGAFRRDQQTGGLKLAYFVAAVIYNFTEATFKMTNPVWIAFLLAATAVARAPIGEGANTPYRVQGRPDQGRPDRPIAKARTYEGAV